MKNHRDTFKRTPYIHTPGRFNETAGVYQYVRPFVRIWQAITPTGKQATDYHVEHYRTKPADNKPVYELPRLRRGYTWQGPFNILGFTTED